MGVIRHNVLVDPELVKVLTTGPRKVLPRLLKILTPRVATFNLESHVADKLGRWYAPFAASRFARRALVVGLSLRNDVPACVQHVVLVTWFNAWCTSRRFQ
eukprot:9154001-Heterocapsa_arctica.AAC.1